MRYRWIMGLLIAFVVVLVFQLAAPANADAAPRDRYWNNYWSWYDNDYRPYYNRHYRSQYGDRDRYRPYYGNRYGQSNRYGQYYGTPRSGYRNYRDGGAVNLGPLRFRWR